MVVVTPTSPCTVPRQVPWPITFYNSPTASVFSSRMGGAKSHVVVFGLVHTRQPSVTDTLPFPCASFPVAPWAVLVVTVT